MQSQTNTDTQVLDVAQDLRMIVPAYGPSAEHNHDEWEDVDDVPDYLRGEIPMPTHPDLPLMDPECYDFHSKHEGLWAIQEQNTISNRWKDLLALLTVIYLKRQHHTSNWTTHTSYLDNHQADYSCKTSYTQAFSLVSWSGHNKTHEEILGEVREPTGENFTANKFGLDTKIQGVLRFSEMTTDFIKQPTTNLIQPT
ncbi:hypothetical protein DFH28DRAFT_1149693 [Melampsora americana]|nr:hypothetical protein DFH28DRAFT_1149693 [Melampsora americana]